MNTEHVVIGVLMEEHSTFSFNEVCLRYNIPEELLIEMVEQGLFAPQSVTSKQTQLTSKDLHRMESAFRLHKDLGINLPGVALALDLLEEIEELRKELHILHKHF